MKRTQPGTELCRRTRNAPRIWALLTPISTAILVTGCAYNVQPTTAAAVNVYTSYEKKIPGKWAVVVDDSVKSLRRDVKPATYICSAHSYPIEVGGALATSVRRTFEQIFEETVARDSIPSPQSATADRLNGSIFVKLDEYQPRLACQQGFWSGTCNSNVDISLGTFVRDAEGKTLISTSAGSSRSADSDAGPGCGTAGASLGDATSRATKDALERLAERLSNATALRDKK